MVHSLTNEKHHLQPQIENKIKYTHNELCFLVEKELLNLMK